MNNENNINVNNVQSSINNSNVQTTNLPQSQVVNNTINNVSQPSTNSNNTNNQNMLRGPISDFIISTCPQSMRMHNAFASSTLLLHVLFTMVNQNSILIYLFLKNYRTSSSNYNV